MLLEKESLPIATKAAKAAPFQNPLMAHHLDRWLQKNPLPNLEENPSPQKVPKPPPR